MRRDVGDDRPPVLDRDLGTAPNDQGDAPLPTIRLLDPNPRRRQMHIGYCTRQREAFQSRAFPSQAEFDFATIHPLFDAVFRDPVDVASTARLVGIDR